MRKELTVIGITGKARSGKDTAAQALVMRRGFHRIGLADAVRSAFGDLSGQTGELFKELTGDHTYRKALQVLGTEGRLATKNPRLWSQVALAKIYYAWKLHPVSRSKFVIPDVRFLIEVATLTACVSRWGGAFHLIRIERPGCESIAESSHRSETEMAQLQPAVTIQNDASVQMLCDQIVSASEILCPTAGLASLAARYSTMNDDLAPNSTDTWGF